MRVNRVWLLVAVIVTALLSTFGASSAAQGPDSAAVEQRVDADVNFRSLVGLRSDRAYVEELVRAYDFSEQPPQFNLVLTDDELVELSERNSVREEMIRLKPILLDRYPSTFAGAYREASNGDVVLQFVKGAERDANAAAALFSRPQRVVVSMVDFTFVQIEQVFTSLRNAMPELQRVGVEIVGLYRDVKSNRVVVELGGGQTREDTARLEEIASLTGVLTIVEPSISTDEHTAHPPHWATGGNRFDAPSGNCSVGLSLYQAGSWATYVSTAGHCANVARSIPSWGVTYQYAAEWYGNYASADAQLYHADWNSNSGAVYMDFLGTQVGLNGGLLCLWCNHDEVGDQVCMSGRNFRSCGVIRFIDVCKTVNGVIICQLRLAEGYSSTGGDSGGAVWSSEGEWPLARGVGIHKGSTTHLNDGKTYKMYSHILYVLAHFGLTDVVPYHH